jgi:release factor glutamine methyltransferase
MSRKHKLSSKKLFSETVGKLMPVWGREESSQIAKLLFEDFLGVQFEQIIVDEDVLFSDTVLEQFSAKIELLKRQHPIQYVLGKAHFYGRDFYVDSRVLIPRQETEELINEVLIDNKRENLKILDIGTGSGCIGITLALELKKAKITVLDVDEGALKVTAKNAERLGVEINYILENILAVDQLPDKYDIIVSNPPYITEVEKSQMNRNVLDHEPHNALFVPNDHPLLFYEKIAVLAKQYLKNGGRLYFEINENYGDELMDLCEKEKFTSLRLIQDINGKNRIVKAMIY